MKLYNVPMHTWVIVKGDNKVPPAAPDIFEEQRVWLGNIDGMYSYCKDERGHVVHLVAWAEVEIDKNQDSDIPDLKEGVLYNES